MDIFNNDELLSMWQTRYAKAQARMDSISVRRGVFIECTAQHSLLDGKLPGPEFTARLDEASTLYWRYRDLLGLSTREIHIYVPGGRHTENGHTDSVSLSSAGTTYLKGDGIPSESIIGDSSLLWLPWGRECFGSEDECKVASHLVEALEADTFICVCSGGQMMRKMFNYVGLGYLPEFHTVCVPHGHHNYIWEYFIGCACIVKDDVTWEAEKRSSRNADKQSEGGVVIS